MQQLAFDPVSHIYTLDGVILPSVTQIMKPLSSHKYATVKEDVLKRAAERGKGVHAAIELHALAGIEDCEQEGQPYFDAYLKWFHKEKPVIQKTESATWHKTLMYAGTVDLIAEINGKRTLIDFKTTAALNDMLTTVQLEAYQRALQSHGIAVEDKAILLLKRDGTYTFKRYPVNDIEAWRVFNALLTIRAYIKKYGG